MPTNKRIQVLKNDGTYVRTIGTGQRGEGNHQFKLPCAVNITPGPDGHLFVVDMLNDRVQIFTKHDGQHVRTLRNMITPWHVESNPDNGHVFVSEHSLHRVQEFTRDGALVRRIGGYSGTGNDKLYGPNGLAIEPGPDGHVYVVDSQNARVQVFTKAGAYVRTLGGRGKGSGLHQFNYPMDVCVDPGPDGGRLYVTDKNNHRVLVFLKPATSAIE